jgi:transcriptional regulator with XRE-family HTH domain
MTITGQQVKPALLLLGWSREKLEAKAGISAQTVWNFEAGKGRPRVRTVRKLQSAFETAGVEFVDGEPGVKMKAKL